MKNCWPKQLAPPFTLPQPRGRDRAFTWPKPRGRSRAFTLLPEERHRPVRAALTSDLRPLTSLRAVGSTEPEAGFTLPKQRERFSAFTLRELRRRSRAFTLQKVRARTAFTLLELLVVVGIIGILMALLAPAFTNIKSGGDATSAAYTIKGVLDTARTYAKANNTYTWVGFFEENVAAPSTNPATAGVGRVVMSMVASNDGTIVYDPNSPAQITTTSLIQVGKLTKIENAHLTTFPDTRSGISSFDTRPVVTYKIGDTTPANSRTPFQYPVGNPAPAAQYTFVKAVQFSPGGEARVDNNADYSLQTAAEIGLEPTHGAATPSPTLANLVAIQFTGIGGNVTIYRK